MVDYKLLEELYSNSEYQDVRIKIESDEILMSDPDTRRLWAQSYYQDSDLLYIYSYDKALKILNNIQNDNDYNETLRLKGAVNKRWWEKSDYKKDNYFKDACSCYLEAIGESDEDRVKDKGYGAYNVLYLYILRDYECNSNKYQDKIDKLLSKTLKIFDEIERNRYSNILDNMPDYKNYWYYTTIAQLYVIKQDFDKVDEFLSKGIMYLNDAKIKGDNPKRQLHISSSEIIKLIKATNQLTNDDACKFIKSTFPSYFLNKEILENRIEEIIESLNRPKLGIALSGGGFRASLFHLGVLARLAELNMLRHVETISAVSGGSIIAMAYYLRVKEELEKKEELEHHDYILLVDKLITEFLSSIQKNIRMNAFSNLKKNCKIIKSDWVNGDYTRTNYLGELYLKEIYKLEEKEILINNELVKNIEMRSLKIIPKDFKIRELEFHPYFDNWNRSSKVPNLIINSTNMTTGHNWKITASGMGETSTMISEDIDKNRVYDYCKYGEFKNTELNKFKISDAVASSSAVPGLFEPIVLDTGINGEKIKLLDGGVYDNQGIQSLVHDNCESIICSDASGYFEDNMELSSSKNKIFMRMTDNLMDLTRDFLYKQTQNQLKQGTIKAFEYFHLKKDIPVDEVDLKTGDIKFADLSEDTNYYVNKKIQNKLSRIRTDLDSFHDMEAYALMNSGYGMCLDSKEFEDDKWDKYKSNQIMGKYLFCDYKESLSSGSNQNERDKLGDLLDISQAIPFKVFRFKDLKKKYLTTPLIVFSIFLLICFSLYDLDLFFAIVPIIFISYVIYKLIARKKKKIRWINLIVNILTGVVAYPFIKFYVKYLNKEYNDKGKT